MNLLESVEEGRRVSVPLVYIVTPDPIATIGLLKPALKYLDEDTDQLKPSPVLIWNAADGLAAMGEEFKHVSKEALEKLKIDPQQTVPAEVALSAIRQAPNGTVCFFYVLIPSAFFQGPKTLQMVWNLRDHFKKKNCMLVFLGPDVTLPPGISNDVLMLTEPQPDLESLKSIVKRQHKSLRAHYPNIEELSDEVIEQSAMATQGLSAFPAETNIAMSLREDGMDLTHLRNQRYDRLDQIKGVSVWRGPEKFADIGGCHGVKNDLLQVLKSNKTHIGAIIFLDEIDKMLSGIGGGDLSGMADEYLGLLLSYMQDHEVLAMLFLGAPGTAKTMVSKAVGNEVNRLILSANMNLMKDHLMGNSEANLNRFFRMVTAVSGGQPMFLASCNSAARLPTSLLRRFKTGRFYFELPNDEEKAVIWEIKLAKYGLPLQPLPDDTGWSGAEIDACAERASLRSITLIEAGKAIIPVSKAAPEEIESLRRAAHLKYLNAATGLPFIYEGSGENNLEISTDNSMRKLRLSKGH